MKPSNKLNRVVSVSAYLCAIAGIGLGVAWIASLIFQNIKFEEAFPGQANLRFHLIIGSLVSMIVSPIIAALRYWKISHYLIASALAFTLLMGNITIGLTLTVVSILILYITRRLLQMLIYFGSPTPEQTVQPEQKEEDINPRP